MEAPTHLPDLNAVLHELVTSNRAILGDNFVGMYLQGSLAVGDFDEHSDVDWIIVTADEMTDAQVAAVRENHPRVKALDYHWAKHLEGSYFPQAVWRDYTQAGRAVWYFDHGSVDLIRSDHCNTVLVRWVVRESGVPLAGPPPAALIDPIPRAVLRREIHSTITDWGAEILATPERWCNTFYQNYLVLNYARMLHDLHRGCPGSKRAGMLWARTALDAQWHALIDWAWQARPGNVYHAADPAAFEKTLDFVRHIIALSEQYAADHDLG
jgi:hypothetical protein